MSLSTSGSFAALHDYVRSIPAFDTHEHVAGFDVGTPVNDREGKNLPQVLTNDYMLYLSSSCVEGAELGQKSDGSAWSVEEAEEQFRAIQTVLSRYRALTSYEVIREGLRELYGFDGDDIDGDNFRALNDRVVRAYREHGEREWLRQACRRLNIDRLAQIATLQYVTDHWDSLPPREREMQKALVWPSLVIDAYLFSGFSSQKAYHERSQQLVGITPTTHAEHLAMCEKAIDLFKVRGGKSVKLLCAYVRSIKFEKVPDDRAAALYAKGPTNLLGDELRDLQDNLFWHLMRMSRARSLPMIVHTGYSLPASFADPENLHSLFRDPSLAGLKVDLCHSGWPNVGGALLMSRTYRHCYFNICWTPMLSESLGETVLKMTIEMTPANKILIGADCGSIESFVGTWRLMQRQLAKVLSEKVDAGSFSIETAKSLARAILRDNAMEFYGVK